MSESTSASADKYADYSREQLLAEINRLKKNKKYGLVWEHKKENVIENFGTQQPYLKEVTEKRIENAPDELTNLIIEGDNFEALSILNYTHIGKVDVIYIDPPYNTGNKDFIYNDDYVDSEDEFRHSKWLSFMEPRLKLARDLLSDNGLIFISIDDNEQSPLKILCDEIFNNENFVAQFCWQKAPGAKNTAKYVSSNHEYIMCYAKKIGSLKIHGDKRSELALKDYKNPDNDPRGVWSRTSMLAPGYNSKNQFEMIFENGKRYTPGNGKSWRYSRQKMLELEKDNRISFEPNMPRKKTYLSEVEDVPPKSLLLQDIGGNNQQGTAEIASIFGDKMVFQFPKPVKLIKYLVDKQSKKDSVVLDFFAGSGTTGQAVLELNKEDGGHRQFILCTNNGDKGPDSTKIAEDITYPRIKAVITGKRQDSSKYSDGIYANLRYYKINHREKKPSIDANRQDLVNYMENILQVKENAYKQLEVNEDFALYEASNKYVGMVFEPFSLEEVVGNLKVQNKDNRPVKLYVFSYSRDAFEDDYGVNFEIQFAAMPEGLLKTYANIAAEIKKEDA